MSPSQHHQTLKGKITYWVAGCLQCFDTVGWRQEGHPACKKVGGWWRWALISPDGVAPSRMVGVSASVNLPLHHKVQKFSSLLAPAHPGGPGKRVIKWLWLWCGVVVVLKQNPLQINGTGFLQAGCPSFHPASIIIALKGTQKY